MSMPDTLPELTDRQLAVLAVITDTISRRGYPPSMREIGDAVGLASTSSVHHQLRTLERRGYIRTGSRGKSRTIELVPRPPRITAEVAAHVLHEFGHRGKAPGPFTAALIEAIARADIINRATLAESYPGYVAAVNLIEGAADGPAQLAAIAGIPAPAMLQPVPCGEAV
jgi:repressor LexA